MKKSANTTDEWLVKGVCEAIRKRRLALEITQDDLAKRCGLHRTYVSDIERGARNLSLRNLQRLSEALELKPSELIRSAENQKKHNNDE